MNSQQISIETCQSHTNSAINPKNAPYAGASQKKILRRRYFIFCLGQRKNCLDSRPLR